MPRPKTSKPSYRLHKPSGQAVVTLGSKDIYLGAHGSQESRDAYDRVIGEWIGKGRPVAITQPEDAAKGITVSQLAIAFYDYCCQRYRRADGSFRTELENYRHALRPLRRLYGPTPAAEFSPMKLEALRANVTQPQTVTDPTTGKRTEKPGWCRKYANRQMSRIKAVFSWGVRTELIPSSVSEKLRTVKGLDIGEFQVRESEPIKPVATMNIDAIKPHLSRQVRAMVELQLLTGARPGEICGLRGVDLDISGKVWTFTPPHHKTKHHGMSRVIRIGPKAQAILRPFLKTDLQAFIFSPADAEADRLEKMHHARKTPLSCGNKPGTNRLADPKHKPGAKYETRAYCRAVTRACEKAFKLPDKLQEPRTPTQRQAMINAGQMTPEAIANRRAARIKWRADHTWSPNQLRHNAGTEFRRQFGLEVAQTLLGHKIGSRVTELYAEIDSQGATDIIAKIG